MLFCFTGVFDARQRHQIKNGHKIGKNKTVRKITSGSCGSLWNVFVFFQLVENCAADDSVLTYFCFSLLFLLQEGNTPQGSSQGVKISEPQKKTSFFRCSLL